MVVSAALSLLGLALVTASLWSWFGWEAPAVLVGLILLGLGALTEVEQ